jgi:hypothetical protein
MAEAAAEALQLANVEAAADDPLDIKPDIVAMRADMDRTKSKPSNQEIALATTSAIDKLSGMMAILANSFNGGPVLNLERSNQPDKGNQQHCPPTSTSGSYQRKKSRKPTYCHHYLHPRIGRTS